MAAGQTGTATISATNDSLNGASCDQYLFLQDYDPGLSINSTTLPSSFVTFSAGETRLYTADLTALAGADGSVPHAFSLDSDGQGSCTANGIVYIIPADELSISKGWNPESPTMHRFRGQVLPTTASWDGVQVLEYFLDSEGSDGCWDDGGFYQVPQTSPNANLPGGSTFNYAHNPEWIIQSNNKWGPLFSSLVPPNNRDQIGFPSFVEVDPTTQVATRRNPFLGWARADSALYTEEQEAFVAAGTRPNPNPHDCTLLWTQHMVLETPGLAAVGTTAAGFAQYTAHQVRLEVTSTTVEVVRDGETSGVLTWP